MKEDYAELRKKEQQAKAILIRKINNIRNKLNARGVNRLDAFIASVEACTNKNKDAGCRSSSSGPAPTKPNPKSKTKAELIKQIDDIRNRLNTASVNALDVFIAGVIAGAKGK